MRDTRDQARRMGEKRVRWCVPRAASPGGALAVTAEVHTITAPASPLPDLPEPASDAKGRCHKQLDTVA